MPTTPRTIVDGSGTTWAICHVAPLPYNELTGGADDGSAKICIFSPARLFCVAHADRFPFQVSDTTG